jgi:hypothetical protein
MENNTKNQNLLSKIKLKRIINRYSDEYTNDSVGNLIVNFDLKEHLIMCEYRLNTTGFATLRAKNGKLALKVLKDNLLSDTHKNIQLKTF